MPQAVWDSVMPEGMRVRFGTMLDLAGPFDRLEDAPDERLADTQVLLTGWATPPLDRQALELLPKLRLIGHIAGTVKAAIPREAWRRGVQVTAAAAANARPVAEFALAAILLAGKRAFTLAEAYRADALRGEPRRTPPWMHAGPIGNSGRVIGLVGASRTGRHLLELLRLFEFRVLLHDPTLPESGIRALGAEPQPLDALVAEADVVSLHAPSLPSTRHLMDRRRIFAMRAGAVLVNTSRGALVDQDALVDAVRLGRIEAVLDTVEPEPLPAGHPLYTLPGVFLTPHIAGSLGNEIPRMTALIAEEVARFLRGEKLLHGVAEAALDSLA
jgi:phosphoglycerate dehydrogenase-like enzyme